jgi:hypothetical protein
MLSSGAMQAHDMIPLVHCSYQVWPRTGYVPVSVTRVTRDAPVDFTTTSSSTHTAQHVAHIWYFQPAGAPTSTL